MDYESLSEESEDRQIRICIARSCRGNEESPGNEKLFEDFAARYCEKKGERGTNVIEMNGQEFCVFCYGCLGGCEGSRVDIVDGKKEVETRVVSPEDLLEKLKAFQRGTLEDYWRNEE